ncbi:hypothetical protein E8E13_000966 [Curvularia kusanoi]|uniref:Uncharacterized protein n=1 Tax=Curvularia kusanoi TaxID=90978 RepID=A0A9P4T412_CURKU|nr:hypothetical protein E8E13_000966 [Curvularia kusanoi]
MPTDSHGSPSFSPSSPPSPTPESPSPSPPPSVTPGSTALAPSPAPETPSPAPETPSPTPETPSASPESSLPSPILTPTPIPTPTPTPAPLPVVLNGNFDNYPNPRGNLAAAAVPWITAGGASIYDDAVLPKRSSPNVGFLRSSGGAASFAQTIDYLDTTKQYQIIFYSYKFDTPQTTCTLRTTMGGSTISTVLQVAPRSTAFSQVVSNAFTPTTSSLELKISYLCAGGSLNRFLIEDVSIVQLE